MKRVDRQGAKAQEGTQQRTVGRSLLGRACAISSLFHLCCVIALAHLHSLWRPFEPLAREDGMALINVDTISEPPAEAPSVHTRVVEETPTTPPPPLRRVPRRRAPVLASTAETFPAGDGAPAALAQVQEVAAPPERPTPPRAKALDDSKDDDDDSTDGTTEVSPQQAPPAPARAVFHVSPGVAQSLRVYDIYPSMPDAMRAAGIAVAVNVEICVANNGAVSEVTMDREAAPALRDVLNSAIRTWRYRPLVMGGNATPFCHDMQLRYSMN
jgi:hypothetical protein